MSARRYTVAEANATLPTLAPLLESLREAQRVMAELHDEVMEAMKSNGGGESGRRFTEASQTAGTAAAEIEALEIIVRDPASGLVDFPSEREGEEIFLCWRLAEDAVAWWHPIDSGFAGRQPL